MSEETGTATDVTTAPDTGGSNDAPTTNTALSQSVSDDSSVSTDVSTTNMQEQTATNAPALDYFKSMPDTWRTELANGDEKRLKQLDRVSDMGVLIDNYFNAQEKIRKGEVSSGLPDNPTEAQLKDWREANGVPETYEGYAPQLEEGLVLGEDDNRIMENVYKAAHTHNIPAKAISDLTNEFLKARQVEYDAEMAQDGIDQQTTVRQLKESWPGGDYDTNLNMIQGLMNQLPSSVKDAFLGGRLSSGKAIFNSPEIMVFFADIARKLDPAGTVVPNVANPMQSIADEIKALESRMTEPEWYKDKEGNERLLQLYEAQERMRAS